MPNKTRPNSSWMLPPTDKQIRAITRLASQLGITEHIEEKPRNRSEARQLIYDLNKMRNAGGNYG